MPSVLEVRKWVDNNLFQWPIPCNITDFRAMLRQGNHRPAPGPDEWEKWCVKNLSDFALSLVLDIHNYHVMNSKFPGDIKDMWLTYIHKGGICTDLINYHGLMLSNFLANSLMTWLNYKLVPYVAKLNVIPIPESLLNKEYKPGTWWATYWASKPMLNATIRPFMPYSRIKWRALIT